MLWAAPLVAPLDEGEADELARAFAALGDPVRIRLLSLVADAGECCACDLVEPIGKSQPTISHHTKVLSDAGILRSEKRGRWVWWSVDGARLAELRDTLSTRSAPPSSRMGEQHANEDRQPRLVSSRIRVVADRAFEHPCVQVVNEPPTLAEHTAHDLSLC